MLNARKIRRTRVSEVRTKGRLTRLTRFFKQSLRLSKDSVGEFDVCNLSLQICKDPVVTPEGILYDREAILTYMLDRKNKIALTKKRKLREAKEEAEAESIPKKVFKGECMLKF